MLQTVADCCHAQASEGAAGALLQFSPNGKYLACVAAAPTSSREASAGAAVTHGGVHGSTQVRDSPIACSVIWPSHRTGALQAQALLRSAFCCHGVLV